MTRASELLEAAVKTSNAADTADAADAAAAENADILAKGWSSAAKIAAERTGIAEEQERAVAQEKSTHVSSIPKIATDQNVSRAHMKAGVLPNVGTNTIGMGVAAAFSCLFVCCVLRHCTRSCVEHHNDRAKDACALETLIANNHRVPSQCPRRGVNTCSVPYFRVSHLR